MPGADPSIKAPDKVAPRSLDITGPCASCSISLSRPPVRGDPLLFWRVGIGVYQIRAAPQSYSATAKTSRTESTWTLSRNWTRPN